MYQIKLVDTDKWFCNLIGINKGRYQVFVDGKRVKLEWDDTLSFNHNISFEDELKIRIEKQLGEV